MTLNQTVAQYTIYVRNSSRVLVGQVDTYQAFDCVLRFNAVSTWTLTVDASAPMAAYLATRGNGIIVNRIITDATTGAVISSTVLLSGPIRGWVRQKQDNTLTVNGLDDLCWVAMRDAYPVLTAPAYATTVLADSPVRYYRLGEPSGTTATDSSTAAQNGTYSSGSTLNQPSLIDDANKAVLFDGVGGSVAFPTTSMPTGNAAMTLECWMLLTANPAGEITAVFYGSATFVAKSSLYLNVNSSGQVLARVDGSTATPASSALALGVPHHLAATWDGTTLTCYVDGASVGTATPGALTLVQDRGRIGKSAGSNFWPGTLDECAIYSTALSAAKIGARYARGISRFVDAAYDTRTGAAETIMRQYVDQNGISAQNDVLGLSRVVSGLSLAVDGAHGSTVTGNARFDALINKDGTGLLQTLALASTTRLGFKVAQSGTSLVFSVYVPTDKTGLIVFSDALGNLADFTYSVQAPDIDAGGNVTIVGGGGQGVARTFIEREDATALATWGRAEMFSDARDTSDLATLQQRGDSDLAQASEQVAFSAVLAPNQSMQFGKDFGLGDKVTVVVDGIAFQDIVREVEITLDSQSGETVTPSIGTPFNASPKDALQSLASKIRATQSRTQKLQRAQ